MESQDTIRNGRSWLPRFLQRESNHNEVTTQSTKPSHNERTSLLAQSDQAINEEDYDLDDGDKSTAKLVLHEFWVLFRGSIPVILAYTLQNSLQTVSVLIVGRLSAEALATAAFSYMFAMASGWLIALGGSTALDSLASASFTGSKNPHDLGVLLQRAFIILLLLYIPVVVLWIFAEPLFVLLHQEAYIAKESCRFLTALAPGGLGYIYFEALKKYLQAQEIMRPGTYVLCITSPVNAGLNYLFVYTFDFGLLGAPIATGISYWLSFLLLLAYTRFVAGWQCWGGWTRKSFRLKPMLTFTKLAVLGVLHVGTEWWAFEIVAIVAGQLGTVPLAAQSVIMTTDQVLNTIPFGVGVATSARVGNLLGARNARGAARAANVAAWLSILLGVLVLAVLMGVKDVYAKIFNDDVRVIKLTADVMPYVALFQIADGLNGSQGGALRGIAKQHVGAAVNILSYYAFALPLGIHLAFNGWGLSGLWLGQCVALYSVGVLEWAIVAFSNWDKEVDKAFSRMDRGSVAENGDSDTIG